MLGVAADVTAYAKSARVAYRQATVSASRCAWRDGPEALRHWQDGLTAVPIVDAGMRQLRAEGWMHNRARLITTAFLTGRDPRARYALAVVPAVVRRPLRPS